MQLFYNADIVSTAGTFSFTKDESRHIVKVLRKKIGDRFHITNGKGELFEVTLLVADPKKCQVDILRTEHTPKPAYRLHMAVAPTKMNERYEWFLEKATEIGVHEITPIICQRSERKTIKQERYEKVVQAAMKQSLNTYLPKLNSPITLEAFLQKPFSGNRFIAHCEEGDKRSLHSLSQGKTNTESIVLIGPEGDFAPQEIQAAMEQGYAPISLGKSRLRTETAAIVACTLVQSVFEV